MKRVILVLLILSTIYALPDIKGKHDIVYRLYRVGKDGPVWMESHKDVDLTKGEPKMGSLVPMPSFSSEYEFELEILIDGELWGERTPYSVVESEALRREVPEETGDISETEAVGLVIQGPSETNNTLLRNSLGIGFGSGDPTSQLDVRSGHVRIWDGGATPGFANLGGDLFVANELEVDGTIYSNNWRDGAGNPMLAGGTDISVSEDAAGQWTINYSGSTDDGDWVLSGSDLYSGVTGNIGIGTSSPASKLDISATGPVAALNIDQDAGTGAAVAVNTGSGSSATSYGLNLDVNSDNGYRAYGIYMDVNKTLDGPTYQSYGIYARVEGGDDVYGAKYLVYNGQGMTYGLNAEVSSTNNSNTYGMYLDVEKTGTGDVLGAYVRADGGTDSYGGQFFASGAAGVSTGIAVSANSTNDATGVKVNSVGLTGIVQGVYASATYGAINYGIRTYASRGPIENYGGYFSAGGTTPSGDSYGIHAEASGGDAATVSVGVQAEARNAPTNYGVRVSSVQYGETNYGLYANVGGTTDNVTNYGAFLRSSGSSTTNNYGLYINAIGGATTTNYGIFSTVSGGTSNYAGYFDGDVRITDRLLDSSGDAGTSGQILTSTGTGTNWAAAPSTDDGDWTISGSNVYRSSGNVGIGTTSPGTKLEVNGDISIPSGSEYRFITGGTGWEWAMGRDIVSTGDVPNTGLDLTSYGGHFQIIDIGGVSPSYTYDCHLDLDMSTGYLGLGTTSPAYTLHVAGDARVTGRIYDSSGDPGTSGQLLSSTVTGTNWIDAPSSASSLYDVLGAGNTMGGRDIYMNSTGSQIHLNHTSSQYILTVDNSTTTGLYYDAANNYWSWRQSGTNRAFVDLDNGYFYASYFSDIDNSTYYLDPSNTSISARLGGDIYVGYSSTLDDDYLYMDGSSEYLRWYEAGAYFILSEDLMPNADNSLDLGNTTYSWDDLYLGSASEININGDNGDAGQVLMSDGTNVYWGDAGGSGGVCESLTENFNTSSWPTGWTRYSTTYSAIEACGYSGSYGLELEGYSGNWVETPELDVSGCSSVNINFYFNEGGNCSGGEEPDNGDILYVQYWTGSAWTTLLTLNGGTEYTSWSYRTYTIYPTNTDFQVRFYYSNGSGDNFDTWHFDQFNITGTSLLRTRHDTEDTAYAAGEEIVVQRNLLVPGEVTHLLEPEQDHNVIAYSSISQEKTITTRGRAELIDGKATVAFDKDFVKLVNIEEIVITATTVGDSRGIHIAEILPTGFVVQENQGGSSNVNFNWIAIGELKGRD